MKFSYNWLSEYLEKKLPAAEKLAEVLAMHSFEVEGVDKVGGDWVLNVDILPNRSDCLSHFGLAREIAAVDKNRVKEPAKEEIKIAKGNLKKIDLEIQCPEMVGRYSAIVIEGIKIQSSQRWLKDKLESVGIRAVNNIVDLTNFVMLESGQPLHAFDYDKIKNQKMILRKSKKGEKVVTLDDIEHELDQDILVMEDKDRLIDLVGIMGGQLSQIDQNTKNIVVQAGAFDRQSIYQTTKELGHSTDASAIYTQGTDLNSTEPALARIYHLLKQLGGSKTVQQIDVYPHKSEAKTIKLEAAKVKKVLGINIPSDKIKAILENSGLKVLGDKNLEIVIPTYRQDLVLPEDLIEEIGRIYGYDKIKPAMPKTALIPPEINEEIVYQNKLRDIMSSFGFSEAYNYSFISSETLKSCHVRAVEIANPTSQENKFLRPCLIPNLLKNVKDNARFFEQIKLFEIGKVFNINKQNQIEEQKAIGGVLALGPKAKNAQEFYQAKGIVDSLLNKLRISDIWYDDSIEEKNQILNAFHPIRRAQIKVGNDLIGWLGEVDRRTLNNFGLKERTAVFELDFDKVVQMAAEERLYTPPSKYPASVRDIAVLVERNTKVSEVLNLINAAGGKLVVDVDLFDIYEGKELPEDRKNLAFHIIYQSNDKTLTAQEVNKLHQKIAAVLEKERGWEVRKNA